MYHMRQNISVSYFYLQLYMQRKRTYWEEIHEDVISDYLQMVESQVM